jgi:lipopolysaccharide export system protein LptC
MILLVMVGSLIWVLSQVATNISMPQKVDIKAPDLLGKNSVLTRFDEQGLKRSVLVASHVTHIPENDTMLFEAPVLTQTEPGKPTIVVVGTRAKTIHKASETWFYDATTLRRAPFEDQAELVIDGRDIWLDSKAEIATSSQFVTAKMGKNHAEGVGFALNNIRQTLELKSKVKMTYVPTSRSALGGAAH